MISEKESKRTKKKWEKLGAFAASTWTAAKRAYKGGYRTASNCFLERKKAKELKKTLGIFAAARETQQKGLLDAVIKPPLIISEKKKSKRTREKEKLGVFAAVTESSEKGLLEAVVEPPLIISEKKKQNN